jgi:hypothetical protein
MELWVKILPKLISSIMSIVDSANLRNKLYEMQDEHELMWTALDDIARMHKDHPAGQHAEKTILKVNNRYGRY